MRPWLMDGASYGPPYAAISESFALYQELPARILRFMFNQ